MRSTKTALVPAGVLASLLLLASACGGGGGGGGGLPCGPGIACPDGQECVNAVCVAPGGGEDAAAGGDACTPVCGERECGDDGCGGACGDCAPGASCDDRGVCQPDGGCVADCDGRQCGSDGCGGSCGSCPAASSCNQAGRCVAGPCTADCVGRECGDDGCGGSCGDCAAGESCTSAGRCEVGPCEPRCDGRACGPDGCGGLCGTCPDGETCAGTACVPGQCGEGAPAIEGALQTDVTDVAFDAVTVQMVHKQDIDPYEDGCLTSIELAFTSGFGCRLTLHAGGAWDVNGGLRIDRLTFGADSQCRNFSDDREGDFELSGATAIGSIVPAAQEVPDENAPESCFPTTLRVRLEPQVIDGQDVDGAPRQLTIEGSTLRVTGEVISVGDTRARCPCAPACDGRECGDDGCGGSCGACGGGARCDAGLCVCVASCAGRECGDDGCGGSCGACADGLSCVEGQCVCVPDCAGRECGPDGCGGSCGTCAADDVCSDGGRCVCEPQCGDRECGPDGCGGSCGSCPAGEPCSPSGVCGCEPSCGGRECGDDGCGGSCGACEYGWTCEADGRCGCGDVDHLGCCAGTVSFWCQTEPWGGGGSIQLRDCGAEGCGWVNDQTGYYCGSTALDPNGRPRDCPFDECEPDCAGRECGPDGCGGSCGDCPGDEGCEAGTCVPCQPDCAGRECGPDGCGGSCGSCPAGENCSTSTGQCATEPPLEEFGKACEEDGDCFEGLTCESVLGFYVCAIVCTPFVDECPHDLTCFPDLGGSGDGYCISSPM